MEDFESVAARAGHCKDGNATADVLAFLPRLTTDSTGQVDFAASDVMVLALLVDASEMAAKSLIRGVASIGQLITHVGPEIEDGLVAASVVEPLGTLLAEICLIAEMMGSLAIKCRSSLIKKLLLR